jgi:hypothetical protein
MYSSNELQQAAETAEANCWIALQLWPSGPLLLISLLVLAAAVYCAVSGPSAAEPEAAASWLA